MDSQSLPPNVGCRLSFVKEIMLAVSVKNACLVAAHGQEMSTGHVRTVNIAPTIKLAKSYLAVATALARVRHGMLFEKCRPSTDTHLPATSRGAPNLSSGS